MSIKVGWRRNAAALSRWNVGPSYVLLMLAGAVILAGCGGGDTSDTSLDETTSAVSPDGNQDPVPSVPAAEEPATIADLFPEGEGREIVLNNCASCHAVACTAIGQRSDGRWQELSEAHSEHVPSLGDEERERAFAYLRENFGADQPEPNVPPRFLERGCTPF